MAPSTLDPPRTGTEQNDGSSLSDSATPGAPTSVAQRAVGGLICLLVLATVPRAVNFIRGLLFCRILDEEQVGRWDMIFSFWLLAAPIAVFGIPGSLGRFAHHYSQTGQLRTFLRRTLLVTSGLALTVCLLVYFFRDWVSQEIFGTPDLATLIIPAALGLGTSILYHTLSSLCLALSKYRLASVLQSSQAVLFAILGVVLLLNVERTAASAIWSFSIATLVSCGFMLWILIDEWRQLPQADSQPLPHGEFWRKIMSLARWVWISNLVTNTFQFTDRLIFIHCGGLSTEESLAAVGQFHSSRVIPLLMVTFATLVAALNLPHFSSDWEQGQHHRAGRRLNLVLKLTGFMFMIAGGSVLAASTILFDSFLVGKFELGKDVVPWSLVACHFAGLAYVGESYLWAIDRAGRACGAYFVALCISAGLNFWLIPRWGLTGMAVATALANLAALAMILAFCRNVHYRLPGNLLVISALCGAFLLGPWVTFGAVALIVLWATFGKGLLDDEEKALIASILRELRGRIAGRKAPEKSA